MPKKKQVATRAIELGLSKLKISAFKEAALDFRSAMQIDPHNADGYYLLAKLFSHSGQDEIAVQVFRQALLNTPKKFLNHQLFVEYQGSDFDAKTTKNFYTAYAEQNEFVRYYLNPSDVLGTYQRRLSDKQDVIIRNILDHHWNSWEKGVIPEPKLSNVCASLRTKHTKHNFRALLLFPSHVNANPNFVSSTYASHSLASLLACGYEAEMHDGDHLCFDLENLNSNWSDRKPFIEALEEFTNHLKAFKPDIVILDGLFEGSDTSMNLRILQSLKSEFKFKLAVFIADAYPPLKNYGCYWAPVADLIVALSDVGYLKKINDLYQSSPKTLHLPCQAVSIDLFSPRLSSNRDIDLLIDGSRRRDRDFWCAHAMESGLNVFATLTDRHKSRGLSEEEYYNRMGRAQLVINSGLVSPGVGIMTFRIFEAICSQALLLQYEECPISDYFQPFIHYVPFKNIHEMICYSQFLLKHEYYRQRIVTEAFNWNSEHFNGQLFWHAIFSNFYETK